MFTWKKLGLVYVPDGSQPLARTHALLPTVDASHDDFFRVYIAMLDDEQFGRVFFVDVDKNDPTRVLRVSDKPALDLGPLGSFDDSGATPSCIVTRGDKKFLYYVGWQRATRVPYMLFTGLAESDDGGVTFRRSRGVPVLDRTHAEPFSRGAPFVESRADGSMRAWYWSCTRWTGGPDGIHYNNDIRVAESPDGITWSTDNPICVRTIGDEYSVGRPWLVRGKSRVHMWYSMRAHAAPYRVGYATSVDGESWERKDDLVGLTKSEDGWDSEMVCYPCVVRAGAREKSGNGDRLFLFYNGNRHGRSGFGVAECDDGGLIIDG